MSYTSIYNGPILLDHQSLGPLLGSCPDFNKIIEMLFRNGYWGNNLGNPTVQQQGSQLLLQLSRGYRAAGLIPIMQPTHRGQ